MGLLGRWRTSFKAVVAILGIYCVIASSANQDSFYANNNLLDELIKASNKKHINVVDFTKDPSLAQDFPEIDILSHILPLVTFECKGRPPGYFADHKFRCEIFHFCKQDGTRSTYSCPFKSRFNQENGACEDEQTVRCNPDIIENVLGAQLTDANHQPTPTSTVTKNVTAIPKKRVARQAIFHQTLPQNTRFVPGSNVLFVPQNPDTGFVRFLVPQQQQPLFHFNLGSNSQFAPSSNGQASQAAQVQQPTANLVPSSSGIFVQSPSTHRAPTIIHADNVQQSSARQGQVFLQQRPATSGNTFGNQHHLPSSGLSLIRQDVPVSRPQAATFQNHPRPPQNGPSQPVAPFGNQQQQQRPSTGSTFAPQQRPQPQSTTLGNQQRPPSTSFVSQPRQVPQGPPRGFDQRRPLNPFGPEFFEDGFPGPSPFFDGNHPRFVAQNTRPQIVENGNGGPAFGVLGRPQTPEGFFFPQPPFQQNPALDEEFFDSDFPQLNLGPPQHPLQRPQSQNEPRPPQHHVGTNFNLSPEDNAFINEIRFPGPPQGHRIVTVEPPKGPTTGRPTENDRRPLTVPQRPQRPPPQGFSHSDSGERGHAQFPSRFPPESQSSFGFQPQHDQRPPQRDQRPPQRDQRPPQRDQRPPQRDQRPPQEEQRPPHRDQRPPQGEQRPPQRDQRPPQHNQRPPQAQFPSGPFFEPPEAPQQPPRRPAPEVPSPPRRPSPSIDSTTPSVPTRPAPSTLPHQRRPQFEEDSGQAQDDRRLTASPARPFVTSTPSSTSKPTRGRGRFRPHQGDEFDFSDQGQDTPQRGPEIEEEAPHRPVSAEAFGIPDPSDDFGSRDPHFQSSPPRRPASHQRRPPATPQFFSANPSRPVELSTPPTVPLRRPSTDQTFAHQPSSGQRFRPNQQSASSNEGIQRGQEDHRGQTQRTPTRQPSIDQRFPSRDQPDSSTEGVQRDQQSHRGQSQHNRPFHFEKPSTELPPDFFSSQEPTFPTTFGTSSEVPDHGNVRPGQNFPQFFSPNENNFGELGFSDENFRRPFSQTTERDRGHLGQSDDISTTKPSFQDSFHPFLQQNAGPNRDANSGPTFSDASIPSAPTFGPQSVDQLAPPELPSFTATPNTPGQLSEPTDVTEGVPRGHVQRGRHTTTSNPRQFSAVHHKDSSSPSDVSPSTELKATAPAKRRRRPVSVTSVGGNGVRTRPTRQRGRGRRPTTTKATVDISNDVTTTAKPRRRVRPVNGAVRKRPIAQRTRAQTTSTTEASKATLAEHSTAASVSKRRPVAKRVQPGNSGTVVRGRRPVSTTTASSDFPDTVDHSASITREHLLSSDSTNRKVSIVSKLDTFQDSAISASHERFTVTKADFQASPETSSIKDHSSMATSTEAMDIDRSTSANPTSATTLTTITPERPETKSTNEISSPSTVTVTQETTTSTTSSSVDSKPEALTKLKLLLNRKFILKLTTEAPSS